jgi:hypothetical protein
MTNNPYFIPSVRNHCACCTTACACTNNCLNLKQDTYGATKRPYRCPLCEGSGTYYLNSPNANGQITTACHGCAGNGIVWG